MSSSTDGWLDGWGDGLLDEHIDEHGAWTLPFVVVVFIVGMRWAQDQDLPASGMPQHANLMGVCGTACVFKHGNG